jgi:hypothetical protein
MRRIVLVLVLVVVLAVAGYMLLRPRRAPARARSRTAQTDSSGAVRPAGTRRTSGRVAGNLKASTKEERRARAKKIREAERARKKALRRAEREKRRMLRKSARARQRRSTRKGSQLYVLKAVVVAGGENYALVDGRKVQVGDFVLGRKIVTIGSDRVEIEAFGKRSTVRVGESLLPSSYNPTTRR